MSLTSYRAAPPRVNAHEPVGSLGDEERLGMIRVVLCAPGRPGGDLLSHVLRRSTIGAEGFHGRVRDGIGCWAPRHDHQVIEAHTVAPDRAVSVSDVGGLVAQLVFGQACCCARQDQADRAISTGQLHALLRVHTRPIDVMVYHGSQGTLV